MRKPYPIYSCHFLQPKKKENGTGLGLASVRKIVTAHKGIINVNSTVNAGTVFTLTFPLIKKIPDSQVLANEYCVINGRETILIVDDEPDLTYTGKVILENFGYKVIPENCSPKALEIYKKHSADIDLVITDLTMPKMTGLDLAYEIKKINPESMIILSTGYMTEELERKVRQFGISQIIFKPFSWKESVYIIRGLLNKKTAGGK